MAQPKSADAKKWYDQANDKNWKGDHEAALSFCDRALSLDPSYYQAWNCRGNALRMLGRNQEAIANFDQALQINPNYYNAWNNRGLALDSLKHHHEEALKNFNKALEIKPNYYQAWNNRGNTLRSLRSYSEAIASYDEALRLTNNQYWQAWNNRGWAFFFSSRYQEALENWDEGLRKLNQRTQSYREGCGELYYSKGRAYYKYSKQQSNPFSDWTEAKNSYKSALQCLTFGCFPYRYLEVLQELLKVYSALGQSQTKGYRELLEKGTQQLEELLRKCCSGTQKIDLEQKFAAFNQLLVDILVQASSRKKHIEALEIAENRKNTCLGWLRQGWNYIAPSPSYQQMQQLLNPKTAAIYWHVSPAAITTFILQHNKPLLTWTLRPTAHISQIAIPDQVVHLPAIRQLEQFEEWMATWQIDYKTLYKDEEKIEKEGTRERWRKQMPDRLDQLGEILEIEKILAHLSDIGKLILIPHRDLHLLPLHYLFPENFTITYLPSFQVGCDLQQLGQSATETLPQVPLLNVEQPKGKNSLLFTSVESSVIAHLYSQPEINRLVGSAATKEAVSSALKVGARVFHFTGHGYHDVDTPAKSFLELANGEQLSLKDIFDLELPSYYLVCLSACETGVTGNQGLIDEFVGLASGFFSKQAIYVVSSLWRVDERSTALLMMYFHQLLKEKGMAPAQALKQAQRWLCNLTNAQLREWYLQLAEKLTNRSDRKIKSFLKREAENLQEDSQINLNECPYAEPYFFAGFTIAGKVL
jgi:CHAT domain-containing protein/Tfp pilus assembly protein PilF